MYLEIDRTSRNPIRNQLYEQLLRRILSGELAPGTQMPSSRYLHEKLNISRNLILEVYDQLASEGYLEGQHGKGTWVSQSVMLGSYVEKGEASAVQRESPPKRSGLIRFTCGIPDLKSFPARKWRQSVDYAWSLADTRLYSYPPISGMDELRSEIADYLLLTKGIRTSAGNIIITSGTAESLLLLASHFAQFTRDIIIEDPVVDFAREIFSQVGYALRPIAVDGHGMDTAQLSSSPEGRLLFVSPSHQFPLGAMLPASRRVALADYAARNDMYIIEDDYDSEFRYEGQPLKSLCLINSQVVIHAGTFSKNMVPSLRLGFIVVPEAIYGGVIATKERLMMRTPAEVQIAMAHFMRSGAFVRHIAAMKRNYRRKYTLLTGALRENFGDAITVNDNAAGLHVYFSHNAHGFTVDECERLSSHGVVVDCEAAYSSVKKAGGLVLGFGNLSEEKIAEGVRRLKSGVDEIIGA